MRLVPLLLAMLLPVVARASEPQPLIPPVEKAGMTDALAAEVVPAGIDPLLFARGAATWKRLTADGRATKPVLALIDYSKPSTQRRLWIVDMEKRAVLFHELVAHGRGTGENLATSFGNDEGSHRSSLGVFVTAETYSGKHGYSLRLDGLDAGLNDKARARAIVIHGADYVSDAFAQKQGRLGRSHGCPALDLAVAKDVIDTIKDGAVVIAWHDDADLIATSALID